MRENGGHAFCEIIIEETGGDVFTRDRSYSYPCRQPLIICRTEQHTGVGTFVSLCFARAKFKMFGCLVSGRLVSCAPSF